MQQGQAPDEMTIATAPGGLIASSCQSDSNGKVLLFDIHRTGARRLATMTVPSGVSALQFVMGGKYLVCSGYNGSLTALRLSDFATGALNIQPQPPLHFPDTQAADGSVP